MIHFFFLGGVETLGFFVVLGLGCGFLNLWILVKSEDLVTFSWWKAASDLRFS